METKQAINLIAISCQPYAEESFNQWLDEIHIPMLLKYAGMTKVTRYKILTKTTNYPTYLMISEFSDRRVLEEYENSPELAAARKEAKQTWQGGEFELVWRVQYEEIKAWVK